MKRISQFCAVFFAIILTTLSTAAFANASAATGQKIEFPSYTCFGEGSPSFHCNKITVVAYLFLPKKSTNKAVFISHGTQGVDARHFDYADSLVNAGIAALVIDHWTTRGIDRHGASRLHGWLCQRRHGALDGHRYLDADGLAA